MDEARERVILSLRRQELKDALDAFGLRADRRSAVQMQQALGQCQHAALDDILKVLEPVRQRQLRNEPTAYRRGSAPRVARSEPRAGTPGHLQGSFVAIDFETADTGRDSACAVALVRVEGDSIVDRQVRLIRPPRQTFEFTYIHGIRWADVAREPSFGPVWNELRPVLRGAAFLAAHNASFDKSVLAACCARAGQEPPALPFECTVRWARKAWGLRPANLPAVCNHLGLSLKHHDAASDAEACARIMIAARRDHFAR